LNCLYTFVAIPFVSYLAQTQLPRPVIIDSGSWEQGRDADSRLSA
jgi:hypothetical protein